MPDHNVEYARLEAEIAACKARIQAMFHAKSFDEMATANLELKKLRFALKELRTPSVLPQTRRKQPSR